MKTAILFLILASQLFSCGNSAPDHSPQFVRASVASEPKPEVSASPAVAMPAPISGVKKMGPGEFAISFETNIPNLKTDSPYARQVILANIHRYQELKHQEIQDALDRQREGAFESQCERIFSRRHTPTDICWLAQLESAWKSEALSHSGAYGYWQFEEFVALQYGLGHQNGVDMRTQFEPSTIAASELLRDNHRSLGDWALAIAAYNGGAGTLRRAVEASGSSDFWYLARNGYLPRETTNYVPAMIANIAIGKNPELYGFSR